MAKSMLLHEENLGIHRLLMDHEANALDTELISALRKEIRELRESGSPPFLLGSSHKTIFSPGWDLKKLVSSNREELAAFLEIFNSLIFECFSYPGPTGVAIGGHSVAGGCLLALACDLRLMSTGRARIGLSELNLGVPVPAGSVKLLSARIIPSVVDELMYGGDGFTGEEARATGIVHRTASPEAILKQTEQTLRTIASKPRMAYVHSKRFLCESFWNEMKEADARENHVFLDCWFSEETQKRIVSFASNLGHSS